MRELAVAGERKGGGPSVGVRSRLYRSDNKSGGVFFVAADRAFAGAAANAPLKHDPEVFYGLT